MLAEHRARQVAIAKSGIPYPAGKQGQRHLRRQRVLELGQHVEEKLDVALVKDRPSVPTEVAGQLRQPVLLHEEVKYQTHAVTRVDAKPRWQPIASGAPVLGR